MSLMVSELSTKEKDELYQFLLDYQMDYRDSLNLPEDVTFGVEIESSLRKPKKLLEMYDWILDSREKGKNIPFEYWNLVFESSVYDDNGAGYEVVSPILTDNIETWNKLNEVCQIIRSCCGIATDECGAHVHVGAENTIQNDPNKLLNIFKLWVAYEDVMFKFGYGKNAAGRESLLMYSPPIAETVKKIIGDISPGDFSNVLNSLFLSKRRAINIQNMRDFYLFGKSKNTIEFRNANGTLDPVVWQNLINVFCKFVLYSTSSDFDEEFVDYKIDSDDRPYYGPSNGYSEIYFERALEIADLIFDNNHDKLNFLKQYIMQKQVPESQHKLTLSYKR